MKRTIERVAPLLVLGGALLLPLAAQAQERPPMPPVRQHDDARPDRVGPRPDLQDADRWLDRLDEDLDLSPGQRERLKALYEARMDERVERREEMRERRAERREDMRERREEHREALRERHEAFVRDVERLLTPEQRERYAELREQRKDSILEHRSEHKRMRRHRARHGDGPETGRRHRSDSTQVAPRR